MESQKSDSRSPGQCLHPLRSLNPHVGPTLSPAPAPGGTLLLLGIIHADLKDGGPLATQKGHGGRCTSCAPFQAVDTATPVLSPEEVVAVVTQAKGMIQFRTLIHNLGMEGRLLGSSRQMGGLRKAQRGHCFISSFIHVLGLSLIAPITWEPLRVIALHRVRCQTLNPAGG